MARFTPERRGELLGLLKAGRTVEEAAASVGVSGFTVHRWARKGRTEDGTAAAAFAERFDAVREGRTDQRLSEDDIVRLLEVAARKGSVTAQKALLDRFERARRSVHRGAHSQPDPIDELAGRRRQHAN